VYPAGSGAYGAPNQPSGPPPAPPAEPIFQVTITKHGGALVFWYNQRRTVTGSYAQCDDAISKAQVHNLLLGWWSFASLIWNPISLWRNTSARKALQQQAEQAQQYAQWWFANHGGQPQQQPLWTPPPTPPGPPHGVW
jgi:hypothetical protein